jgi:uncharacterized protein (DUF362 family)/Pyruvate/2-oxoacid:ferredoxin oxidoreductase delta subunit
MSRSKVALIRCNTYDEATVFAAVQRGIMLLGGMTSFIQPGEKIVLKPNVLVGDTPEKLVSPHPTVFKAVAQHAQAVTPNLSYGDSPGFGRHAGQMQKAGLAQAADALGIPLADFENGQEVQFRDSPFTKRFVLANGVLQADGLISIGKFKTHGLMRITGAVKNQFGCIPGMLKAEFHIKLPNALDFGKMLVSLNLYIRPRLYVVDGITAMQGNGPRGGDSCDLHALLFAQDPVALDAVMCRLIDLDPEYVPTMKPGREWGLGTYLPEEIELVGDPLEPLVNKAFNVVRAPVKPVTDSAIVPFFRNLVSPRPVIDPARCTKCGTCVHVCPATPKAVDWHHGDHAQPPVHTYQRCIRCYCCQELCPERAITIQTPILGRLVGRNAP